MTRTIPEHLQPIAEAAREVGLAVETLYRWHTRGLLRYRIPGDRRSFIDRRKLAELLRAEER